MVVIRLHGVLESIARRAVHLHVDSFEEAIRGLKANFPKLMRVMRDMRVSIMVDGKMLTFEDCLRPMSAERIDIVPIVGGAGPAIFIVVGAILEASATAIAAWAAGIGLGSIITAASIAQFGLAMIIGGISQLLFKPPKPNIGSRAEDTASYNFNGATNVTQQGNVVPIGYGRLRVGSMVVGVNVQTWDIPTNDSVATGPAPPAPPSLGDPTTAWDSQTQ